MHKEDAFASLEDYLPSTLAIINYYLYGSGAYGYKLLGSSKHFGVFAKISFKC